MGLAPSEKHLEDWIVANVSQFGERLELRPNEFYDIRHADQIIARQVRFNHGIADLIASRGRWLQVIELKRGDVDSHTLAQILRYMRELREICWDVILSTYIDYPEPHTDWDYSLTGELLSSGVIVGHQVHDVNILLAADACEIPVILYDYDPLTGYTFKYVNAETSKALNGQLIEGVVGQAIKQSVLAHIEWRKEILAKAQS